MATGIVKWFNMNKGFGFITPDEGDRDVFVHSTALQDAGISTLAEGQRIEFEAHPGRDGKVAAGKLRLPT